MTGIILYRQNMYWNLLKMLSQKIGTRKKKVGRSHLTVAMIKAEASRALKKKLGNTVRYGAFNGLRLSDDVWWGKHDIGNKLLGQYEYHVVQQLVELSQTYDCLIDIGAADGYFAVGAAKAGLFSKIVCFEIGEEGRRIIRNTAQLNEVADRVIVNGIATEESLGQVIEACGPAAILCDIEGAEFDLLTEKLLNMTRDCTFIVELHDNMGSKYNNQRTELLERAQKNFDVAYLVRSNPPVHSFQELNDMPDDSRLLIFSESRPVNMDWLLLTPKAMADAA
jgi:hypothetical protein